MTNYKWYRTFDLALLELVRGVGEPWGGEGGGTGAGTGIGWLWWIEGKRVREEVQVEAVIGKE